jgi:hypothetical protein
MTERQTERVLRGIELGARYGAVDRLASEVLREARGSFAPLAKLLSAVEYAMLIELKAQWEAKEDEEGNLYVCDESPFKQIIDQLDQLIGELERVESE